MSKINAFISQISYKLPNKILTNTNQRLAKKTGIQYRHVCENNETASDLAYEACKALIEALPGGGRAKDNIDFILLCTQSPDYILPTTACLLQNKLSLPLSTGCLDYNLGCSGYVYGLGLAKGLIESQQANNVLLVTAEAYSKYINEEDKSVSPLFGDAATATLISGYKTDKSGISGLSYGTDGSGAENLIIPVGASRNPYETTPITYSEDEYGNKRSNRNLFMNGSSIMEFSRKVVPNLVEKILQKVHLTKTELDYCVFHQANRFMLQILQSECELTDCNFWNDVKNYGNTVSNSIPIALYDLLSQKKTNSKLSNVLLCGFGVGLSWGGCIVDLSKYGKEIENG